MGFIADNSLPPATKSSRKFLNSIHTCFRLVIRDRASILLIAVVFFTFASIFTFNLNKQIRAMLSPDLVVASNEGDQKVKNQVITGKGVSTDAKTMRGSTETPASIRKLVKDQSKKTVACRSYLKAKFFWCRNKNETRWQRERCERNSGEDFWSSKHEKIVIQRRYVD